MSMRRFHLERLEDASGVSGCGSVAEGVIFSDGKIALEWFGSHVSTNLYASLADVEYIHGHEGRTRIIFDDPDELSLKEKTNKNDCR
jgi:hypothetical protein